MRDVRELESLIVMELRDIKGLESSLDQRFAGLGEASRRTRASFIKGLMDLEQRARGVEELIEELSTGARQMTPSSVWI